MKVTCPYCGDTTVCVDTTEVITELPKDLILPLLCYECHRTYKLGFDEDSTEELKDFLGIHDNMRGVKDTRPE